MAADGGRGAPVEGVTRKRLLIETAKCAVALRALGARALRPARREGRPASAGASSTAATSTASRALSFNGLVNAQTIAAIHRGRHVNPTFAGDTVYASSEVLERQAVPGRDHVGALRLRTVAARDRPCADFPYHDGTGAYDPAVVLGVDYTVLMPRRV